MSMHETNAERIATVTARLFPAARALVERLVRIPSVSWPSFDPRHVDDSAQAVADAASSLNVFDTVEICSAECDDGRAGAPAVLARRKADPGHPTVMLYAHHDVQPPGDAHAWATAPFEPTVRGERLYGRGAADDKAGIATHLAAVEALSTVVPNSRLGITLFVEGEEEAGSGSFGSFLQRYRDDLAADVIIIADSVNWSVDVPSLTSSLRGNVTFDVTVSTLDHPVHSGMYGGAVPDATLALVSLLASLHDDAGSVAVHGLVADDVPVPDYDEERLRTESSLLPGVDAIGRGTLLSRLWLQPAITVTGIDAPPVDEASNTLAAQARARLSVRVAPGQNPAEAYRAVEEHLRRHVPFGARLRCSDVDLGAGYRVADDSVADLMRTCLEEAWETTAVDMGIGGSIPFISQLAETYPAATVLITGVEDPDTRAHSPNESLHLEVFRKAILSEALFLAHLENHVG